MQLEFGGDTLFLSHQNADADAIGSLYFLNSRYGGKIGLPDPPSASGKRLAEYLGLEFDICPDVSLYEPIVVVDTPDPKQLEPIVLPEEGIIVIDHHRTNLWDDDVFYQDRTSCTELLFDLVKPRELTEKEAMALISGIVTDTSNLRRGDVNTFTTLGKIMSMTDVTLNSVFNILSQPRSYSERISRLKGATRLDFQRINGCLIAYSYVSSFESSICSMLLNVGADVALAASQRGNDILISARVRGDLTESGFDIGAIFKDISETSNTLSGSGHPGAGVIQGRGDVETVIKEIVDMAIEMIRKEGITKPLT